MLSEHIKVLLQSKPSLQDKMSLSPHFYRTRTELMESIRTYKPIGRLSKVQVLLIGPVGAGKSSFFNSVNSVFRGHVTSQAMSGSSATSLTTQVGAIVLIISIYGDFKMKIIKLHHSPSLCILQFRTYSLKDGREGKPLPIILCDTMGLEESNGAGLNIDDVSSIIKGHLSDGHQVQYLIKKDV